jgi:transcription elongation factor Elf1
MQLACPKCGIRDARVSARSGIGETLKAMCGIYALRCRRCRTRWETSMWSGDAWKYAHCPRCYRQELTTWSLQYYHPPTSVYLKIKMGATPFRCAACRCNFASFRQCREKFAWRHRTHVEPAPPLPAPAPTASLPLNEADLSALTHAVGTESVKPEVRVRDTVEPML